MRLVDRRPRHEIHGLDEHALDVILNHEIRKLVPHAFLLVIRTEDKEPPHAESVLLDIPDGAHDILFRALLVISPEGLIVDKFNAHIQFKKARFFQQLQHLVVKADFISRLHIEPVADAAVDDGVEHGHRPFPVRKKIIIRNPQIFDRAKMLSVKKCNGLTDVFHHIFR